VDLATSFRVLARRWYVSLPLLALTVVAVQVAAQAVRPAFQATGTVVLLAPTTGAAAGAAPWDRNPYLRFDKNLEVVAGLMSTVLNNPIMVERLRAAGATGTYDVGASQLSSSPLDTTPLVEITATGPDEQSAKRTVAVVAHYLSVELVRHQRAAGAPTGTLIRTQVTTPPTVTGRIVGSTTRAVGATAVLGLAATIGAAHLAERLARRGGRGGGRRARRRGRPGAPEAATVDLRDPVPAPEHVRQE
jgi:hypothetical protein